MRGSNKSFVPASFVKWLNMSEKNPLSWDSFQPTYRALQNPEKKELVDTLYKDQLGCCVYCGVKLDLDKFHSGECHTEHFRPQSDYPAHQLTFENLYLSCGHRNPDGTATETCGPYKKDWFDPQCYIYPDEDVCQTRFSFGLTGKIIPTDINDTAAQMMIDMLNLDAVNLVAERKRIVREIDETLMEYEDPKSLNDEIEELIGVWGVVDAVGTQKSFAHVAVRYLAEF